MPPSKIRATPILLILPDLVSIMPTWTILHGLARMQEHLAEASSSLTYLKQEVSFSIQLLLTPYSAIPRLLVIYIVMQGQLQMQTDGKLVARNFKMQLIALIQELYPTALVLTIKHVFIIPKVSTTS